MTQSKRSVSNLGYSLLDDFRILAARVRLEEQGGIEVVFSAKFVAVVENSGTAFQGVLARSTLDVTESIPHVQVSLHYHLHEQENTQDFVATALIIFRQFPGEDISQTEYTLAKLIVSPREVEDGHADSIDRRR